MLIKKFNIVFVCGLFIQLVGQNNLCAADNKIKLKSKEEKAKVYIEPFGNVKWDSDVKDVLNYICQIDSVEKIGFIKGKANISDSLDDDTYYLYKKEVCENSNFDIFEQAYQIQYITTPEVRFVEEYVRNEAYEFFKYRYLNKKFTKNIDNKNYILDSFGISIVAKPIKINNINFNLVYAFASHPDISVGKYLDKKEPLSFNFEDKTYYGYNYLNEVFLMALGGQQESLRLYSPEIIKLLEKKYNLKESQSSDELTIYGSNIMNRLFYRYRPHGITFIDYNTPDDVEKKYKGKYDELLKSLTKKSGQDMGNAL